MKTLAASLFIFGFAVHSPVDTESEKQQLNLLEHNNLYACYWFPNCADPDRYSPILQPKDSKTETQDVKDEKLA